MKRRLMIFTAIFFLVFTPALTTFGADPADSVRQYHEGRETFRTYCSSCHAVHKEIVGPMLASVPKKRPREWLLQFIRNSQDVIISGDEYARFLYAGYNQYVMPSFPQLSDEDIENILSYIEEESLRPRETTGLGEDEVQNFAQPFALQGKEIFQMQCANCHFIDKEHDRGGPALGSVSKRRPMEWLIPFIKNSQKVIQQGDPYAVHLFDAFDHRIMVPMEFLTEDDIKAVLHYIEAASSSDHTQAGVNGRPQPGSITVNHRTVPVPAVENEYKPFFKTLLLIASAFAALVHGFLTVRLFQYLRKEKGA